MALTKPSIYKINAFDVSVGSPTIKAGFTNLDTVPTIISATLNIYNNDTNTTIGTATTITLTLDSTSTTSTLAVYTFQISSSFLSLMTNGSIYYLTISVDNDGTTLTSNSVVFNCYTTPLFVFNNIPTQPLQQSSYKMVFEYQQAQNELLNWYQCSLYNNDTSTLIFQSDKIYKDIYSYTFYSLTNNINYNIIISGETVEGTTFSNSSNVFQVSIQENPNSAYLTLKNVCSDGYIKINSNFSAIPGIATNTSVENNMIDTKIADSNVIWNETIEQQNLTVKEWCKSTNFNSTILTLSDSENSSNRIVTTSIIGDLQNPLENAALANSIANSRYFADYNYDNHIGIYLATSITTNGNILSYSYDGTTWQLVSTSALPSLESNVYWYTEVYNNWIIVYSHSSDTAINTKIYFTHNLTGWGSYQNVDSSGTSRYISNILYNGNIFFIYYYLGCSYSDGNDLLNATWTKNTLSYTFYNTFFYNGIYLGNTNSQLKYSLDGLAWNNCLSSSSDTIQLNLPPFEQQYIRYFDNKYLAYSFLGTQTATVFSSSDGIKWNSQACNGNVYIYGQVSYSKMWEYNNALWSFMEWYGQPVSNQLLLRYSYDGINWYSLTNKILKIDHIQYGSPFIEFISSEFLCYLWDGHIYSLYLGYSSVQYNTTVYNLTTHYSFNSNILTDVTYNDWVYVGTQLTFNATDENIVDSGSVIIANKGSDL